MFPFKEIPWILMLIIQALSAQETRFCEPYTDNLIPFDQLPELDTEFEADIQLTLPNKFSTVEIGMLYDYNDNRAELYIDENGGGENKVSLQAFFYDKNELFDLSQAKQECNVTPLNETKREMLFFGLNEVVEGNFKVLKMDKVEDVLHFRQPQFNFIKGADTTYRGIPVEHYKSCQYWPLIKSIYHIDYFFTKPGFQPGVSFYDRQIPIAAIIQGTSQSRPIHNEYMFFKYRPRVEKKKGLFAQPVGYYCKGATEKQPLPDIPIAFSMVSEIIGLNFSSNHKVAYSDDSKVESYESISKEVDSLGMKIKTVNDFNSGISYILNLDQNTCKIEPITSTPISYEIGNEQGFDVALKKPLDFFLFDASFYYAGQRYERGRLCDIYVANRTDLKNLKPNPGTEPAYWILEWYFLNLGNSDIGIDGQETVVPVSLKITGRTENPINNTKYVFNYYDFDTTFKTADAFDVTPCFKSNQKMEFAIKFTYPKQDNSTSTNSTLSPEVFEYFFEEKVIREFYKRLFVALDTYNYSPFRIIPPKIRARHNSFMLYTGFTDRAPDIKHFTKTSNVRCDPDKAKNQIVSDSADGCATICLDSSKIKTDNYKCLSFDFCSEQKKCSFYNFSHISDPNVILESAPYCEHYSKTVDDVDAVSKEEVYRLVEDLLTRGDFDLNIDGDETFQSAEFEGIDIFQASYEAEPANFEIGTSSYFDEFLINKFNTDFDVAVIASAGVEFVRQRELVSVDECSRLCMRELTFICQSFTFNNFDQSCKWSSISGVLDEVIIDNKNFIGSEGWNWFTRDPLYTYKKYSEQVTSVQGIEYVSVKDVYECASKCENSKETCRSFNFCQDSENRYKCSISSNHINSTESSSEAIYSPICDHYSKKTLFDFQLVSETQLNREPRAEFIGVKVDNCANLCVESDSFVCRSFDFGNMGGNGICFLYEENLRDHDADGKVNGIENPDCSHYSRVYFIKNGVQVSVEAKMDFGKRKYSGGTMSLITILCAVIAFALGVGGVLVYQKIYAKKTELPSMEFINPNYTDK